MPLIKQRVYAPNSATLFTVKEEPTDYSNHDPDSEKRTKLLK
ncbi:hypothetical protein [Aquibacillus sediminis]|nr:hypothetical protein [Aquibacillus sediminis]